MKPGGFYTIGYVSRQTGLSPHVIRAWERRYGFVDPNRSETNRRIFSVRDLERLMLAKRAVDAGHSISRIAGLDDAELGKLAQPPYTDRSSFPAPLHPFNATTFLNRSLDAVMALDRAVLGRTLLESAVSMPKVAVMTEVLAPLLHRVGSLWAEGGMRILHEHMATAVIHGFLWDLFNQAAPVDGAPAMVVATPSGQLCELGALMAAVIGSDCGWDVHYFGANLPPEEIAAAALHKNARAVAMSLAFRPEGRWLVEELKNLMRFLPAGVSVYAGGRGLQEDQDGVRALGIRCFDDLNAFSTALAQS